MGSIKERNEVEDKYKWDLKVIYKSNDEYNKEKQKGAFSWTGRFKPRRSRTGLRIG